MGWASPVWGIQVGNTSQLASISASHCCQVQGTKKNLNFIQPEWYLMVGQEAEFKFESKFQPLPVIWQTLQKTVSERNWRLQNQWPSTCGSTPAQVGLVWLWSTDSIVQVCCSRFWMPPAWSRKKSYSSCYSDSVWESKRFNTSFSCL